MEKRTNMRLMPLLNSHPGEGKSSLPKTKAYPSFLRQTFSLLLSFILLFNAIGYYPLFKIKQWQVHTEVQSMFRKTIPNKNLQCITVSNAGLSQLNWEWEWEDEQEFTYQGKRYDVVRSVLQQDVTHYFCIEDTQETKLFAQLDEEVERHLQDETNPLHNTTKKLLKNFSWITSTHADDSILKVSIQIEKVYCFHDCLYDYHFFNLITPPPKQLI